MSVFKKKDVKIALCLSIVSIIIFTLTIIFWKNITFLTKLLDGFGLAGAFIVLIMSIITFVSFIGCISFTTIIIMEISHDKNLKKAFAISYIKVKKLTNEYSEIKFKDFANANLSDFISEEDIHCFAKLDENGNIVYKIQVDVEKTTADYLKFTDNFEIRN